MKNNIKYIYFIGVGGIGMSAIARYFNAAGVCVTGYDKTNTELTQELINEGIAICFDDQVELLNSQLLEAPKDEVLIVVTPAIPSSHKQLNYFKERDYTIKKRAEVLGIITKNTFTAGVAGTHGKTTTSTILTHILKSSGYDCTAFLGGIAKNYNSNYIAGLVHSENQEEIQHLHFNIDVLAPTIVEADEYDRSFLTLHPDIAVVTSVDADHLDIYNSAENLKESFSLFTSQIKPDGSLISKLGLEYKIACSSDVKVFNYSLMERADFFAHDLKIENGHYVFNLTSAVEDIADIHFALPGLHNVENAVAAIAAAQLMGVVPFEIKKALKSFEGVKRRFDYRLSYSDFVYIDDYAHHPEEIRACITSIRELFPNKKITGVFQPHLYSRTRDFIDGFAESLSLLDELILLEIYPARELPIEGVNSSLLLHKITCEKKQLLAANQVVAYLLQAKPEVLLTIGAGDIDQLVKPIENAFKR